MWLGEHLRMARKVIITYLSYAHKNYFRHASDYVIFLVFFKLFYQLSYMHLTYSHNEIFKYKY